MAMNLGYNKANKEFTITSDDGLSVSVPFGFKDSDVNGNQHAPTEAESYVYGLYYKHNVPELEYKKININQGTQGGEPKFAGWMLPINLLTTKDPVILALPHINDYVYYAFCYVLKQEAVAEQLFLERDLSEVLEELYPNGTLLVLNSTRIPNGVTIQQLELSLASFGYFRKPSNHLNSIIASKIQNDGIALTPCKEILNSDGSYMDPYISEFLEKYAGEKNSFFWFFYLYQIVEVLLDKELIVKLQDYIKLLETNKATIRKYDKLMQNSTESDRFKAIISNAKLEGVDYPELKSKCNQFISSDPDNHLEPPECIYQVRNHVMHRFRKAIEDEQLLLEICEHLELYLYDVLIRYKRPKANA